MKDWLNFIYTEVHNLLAHEANFAVVERDGHRVSPEETYARVKLWVCQKLLEECSDWTLVHYKASSVAYPKEG